MIVKQEQWLTCTVFLDSALKLAVIPVIVSMGDVQVVATLGGRCLHTETNRGNFMVNTVLVLHSGNTIEFYIFHNFINYFGK